MAATRAFETQGFFEPLSTLTGGRLSPVGTFPKGFVVFQANNKTLTQADWKCVTSSLKDSSFAALQWHHWATASFHRLSRIRFSPLHIISCSGEHISAWNHAGVCVCVFVRDNMEVWLYVLVKHCQKLYLKAAVWNAACSLSLWEFTFVNLVCDTQKHCKGDNWRLVSCAIANYLMMQYTLYNTICHNSVHCFASQFNLIGIEVGMKWLPVWW